MKKYSWIPLLLLTCMLGSACASGPDDNRPSEKAISEQWGEDVPRGWKVRKFNIEAQENTGNTVEPLWHSRFVSELVLTEDLYDLEWEGADAVFVRKVAAQGKTVTIHGRAESTLDMGNWKSRWDLENGRDLQLGVAGSVLDSAASTDGVRTIVVGSPDEAQYLDELQAFFNSTFSGLASTSSGDTHALILRFEEFDRSSGEIRGQVEWPELSGAVKRVRGRYEKGRVLLEETEWVAGQGGSALFGISYEIEVPANKNKIDGKWDYSWNGGSFSLTRS